MCYVCRPLTTMRRHGREVGGARAVHYESATYLNSRRVRGLCMRNVAYIYRVKDYFSTLLNPITPFCLKG